MDVVIKNKKVKAVWARDWHLPSVSTGIESWSIAAACLQYSLKGAQGGDQVWGTLCSGTTGRTGLQIDIFRFYEPNSCISLYQEKPYNCSWWHPSWLHLLAVAFTRWAAAFCKLRARLPVSFPSPKSHIYWHSPCFFRAVFQSNLKCHLLGYSPHFAPNKT